MPFCACFFCDLSCSCCFAYVIFHWCRGFCYMTESDFFRFLIIDPLFSGIGRILPCEGGEGAQTWYFRPLLLWLWFFYTVHIHVEQLDWTHVSHIDFQNRCFITSGYTWSWIVNFEQHSLCAWTLIRGHHIWDGIIVEFLFNSWTLRSNIT